MAFDFSDSVVVVTGGTTGIGKAVCDSFVAAKATAVYNLDSTKGTSEGVHHKICDVSKVADLKACFADICAAHGDRVDVLVSNAGVWTFGAMEETSEEEFDRVLGINVKGCYFAMQAALPAMTAAGRGSIVVIGSDQSFVGKGGQHLYGLTKGALGQLSKSAAAAYATKGVRVNCVCPGTIDTPLMHGAVAKIAKLEGANPEDLYEWLQTAQPLPRLGQPQEVADAVLACCALTNMTGALVAVDGGYTAV